MNRLVLDILKDLNEGIVVLDENYKIVLWNNQMILATNYPESKAIGKSIYDVLPKFKTPYYMDAMESVISSGSKMFFSAAMHKNLINDAKHFNIKLSKIESERSKYISIECVDVTNQFQQIQQLKCSIQELCKANAQLKENEKVIANLAYYDNLTGVANRTLFYELAENLLKNSKRNESVFALMFLDVDQFKNINDTYGHEAGDKVLKRVAEILTAATRENDVVARHGGDEFLILLPFVGAHRDCEEIACRIVNGENMFVNYNGRRINISLSMGISFYPGCGNTVDKLIAEADKAMYIAKNMQGDNMLHVSEKSRKC